MDFNLKKTMKLESLRHASSLILASVSFALLLVSCDSLVQEDPQDRITSTNFYETEADAIAAVNAVYAELSTYYLLNWDLTDGPTDDLSAKPQADVARLALSVEYSVDATNSYFERAWQNAYEGINSANAVLGNVPAIQMDEALKRRVLGEARFLRALFYFNLVRFFGDVPLLTHEIASLDSLNVGGAPTEEVYGRIISDLKQAAEGLPISYSSDNVGRVTRGAAQTLLAKVYLTQENYSEAARYAGMVISSGTYALLPEWKEVFRIRSEHSGESIFEVDYDEVLAEGSLHTMFGLPSGYPGGGAFGVFYVLDNLTSIYSADDVRGKDGTYMTSPYTDRTGTTYAWDTPPGPSLLKWFDDTSTDNLQNRRWKDQKNNWYVFRYAEVLLIYAEAVNEGGAPMAGSKYEALNAVRTRAGLKPVSGPSPSAFRDAVRLERRRELVFEGKRWFDLKRWSVLVERIRATKNPDVPQNRALYPIPQRELDVNPELTQNPGY